jgi:acetolactate synthase-1/2/3 large subunit
MLVRPTVADTVADGLAAAGVDTVFCVPGAHIDDLCHSINSHPTLRLVVCRTEAGSAMMAIGHARTSGTVACCLAIPGPGLLDLGTSLAIARSVGTPLLCVAGTISSRFEGLRLGLLHEAPQVFRDAPELVGSHTYSALMTTPWV